VNELVKIDGMGNPKVSGRNLHMFLGVGTEYAKWFSRMCEYDFTENEDYKVIVKNDDNPLGGRPATDHELTLDMAKELCMIQRTENGKQARRYFLQIEKDWNSPEKIMARALLLSKKQNDELVAKIETDKPLVLFARSVQVSSGTILIRELAKIITQNGYEIGEKRLFAWLREKGYLVKKQGKDYNKPMQRSMELGLFEISETTINHNSGLVTISTTTRVTGKGQIYFINKFKRISEDLLKIGAVK
jgi:anti-repressor protein